MASLFLFHIVAGDRLDFGKLDVLSIVVFFSHSMLAQFCCV